MPKVMNPKLRGLVFNCEDKEHNAKQEKRTTRFLSVEILSESLPLVREKINKHLKL